MKPKAIGDGSSVIDVGFDVDPRDQQIESLKAENRRLQREAADAERAASRAQEDANRALSALRRQLSPLFRALQMVFGELDAAGVTDASAPATPTVHATDANHASGRDAREMALWNDWKAKLPPPCGKVIDALLLHPDLTVKQLKITARMGENSIYQATSRLGQAGLLIKNGGRFSLKQL